MSTLTDKKFWDSYYQDFKPRIVEKVVFADVFEKYLSRFLEDKQSSSSAISSASSFVKTTADKTADNQRNYSLIEIGCAGGDFLCYLTKRFGFEAHGVDYSDEIWTTEALFKYNDLPKPILHKEDFFTWRPEKKFDVVCSFGFVEHFDDLPHLVRTHADLVAPGGTLIITIPHFAHLQYFFHWLIDRENLKKHNTKIMNLKSLREAFKDLPFSIEHLSYYRTFGFWTEKKPTAWWEKLIYESLRFKGRVINKLLGPNKPNPLFSPHIVCIAKRS